MSITQAVFKVHRIFQNVIPTPCFVNVSKNTLVPHPFYQTYLNRHLRWQVMLLSVLGLPTTYGYLVWLLLHWNPQENSYMLHVLYYILLFTVLLILNHNFYIVNFKTEHVQFVVTQCHKLTMQNWNISTNPKAKYTSAKKLFVYGFAFSFVFVVLGLAYTPFIGKFDPLQLLLGSSYFAKVACCVIYAYSFGLQTWYLCSTLLLTFSILEMIDRYTSRLVLCKFCATHGYLSLITSYFYYML